MSQKPLQIFSLKTNLVPHSKGVALTLNKDKTYMHGRIKSGCFHNMINTIRTSISRQPEKDISNIQQNGKQNNKISIQAKSFKAVYGLQTPMIAQPPRMTLPPSRSFMIRSHHKKSINSIPQLKSSQLKSKQPLSINPIFHLFLKSYNFQSCEQIIHHIKLIPQSDTPITSYKYSISCIIPWYFLPNDQDETRCQEIKKLFKCLQNGRVNVFVLVLGNGRSQKLSKEFGQFCNILVVQDITAKYDSNRQCRVKRQDSLQTKCCFSNKNQHINVFLNFNDPQIQQKIADNLLIFQGNNSIKNKICFFPHFSVENVDFDSFSKTFKMTFARISSINALKSISLTNQSVKIQLSNCQKRPHFHHQQYHLKNYLKLQLEQKHRYSSSSKNSAVSSVLPPVPIQNIQQKLLSYSKILKKQSLFETNNPPNSTSKWMISSFSSQFQPGSLNIIPNANESMNGYNKLMRKSLASKSAYQIINQLIRNNINTHKQINTYIQETKGINIKQKHQIVCDNIYYFCIE